MAKRPSFQFYPKDYREDLGLRACSLAARGLWVELMCLAHDGEPYGHLARGGNVLSPADIARNAGASPREVARCIEELERWGVFSRSESGAIYSRRMVRDEEIREKRAAGGKEGAEGGSLAAKNPNASVPGDARKGGRPQRGRGDSKPPFEPPPSSASASSSPSPKNGHSNEPGSSVRANPLVGNRTEAEAEVLRLCTEIAEGTRGALDASEVLANASEFRGRRAVNPASMTDDRLLHTLHTLRRERRRQQGLPADGQPASPLSSENRDKVSGIAAWLRDKKAQDAARGGAA